MIARKKSIYIFGAMLLGVVTVLVILLIFAGAGAINSNPHELEFVSGSAQAVYDGKALACEQWELKSGKLDTGHTARVTFGASQRDVGSSQNTFEVKIFDEQGSDVSNIYDIKLTPGTLTVDPLHFEIGSGDATKTYDGTILTEMSYRVLSGTLPAGHTLSVAYTGRQITAGKSSNSFTARILDSKGRNVSFNFDLVCIPGELEVTKRPITVTSESVEKVYDGEPLSTPANKIRVSPNALADGHSINFTGLQEIVNAGSISNTFVATVTDSSDDDVSANYDIKYSFGTLTVKKCVLPLASKSLNKAYDGKPLKNSEKDLPPQSTPETVRGHKITCIGNAEITEVGTVDNEFTAKITDSEGVDVTANYDIGYTFGKLTVQKREVMLTSESKTSTYSAEPQSFDAQPKSENLPRGFTAVSSGFSDFTDAGTYDNTFAAVIRDAENVDQSHNFDIRYTFGKINIQKVPVTLTSRDATQVYDAKGHTFDSETNATKLPYGCKAVFDGFKEYVDAGSYDNTFGAKIYLYEYVDVTHNFDITYVYGRINIQKRPITLASRGATQVYDGARHSFEGDESKSGLPVGNIEVVFYGYKEYIDAGSYDNTFGAKITYEYGDITHNFDITYVYGRINILKYSLDLISQSATFTYDGNPHSYSDLTCTLPGGCSLNKYGFNSFVDAGTYDNTFAVNITLYGEDVKHNFDINYVYGTVIIDKCSIVVSSGSDQKQYDGEPLENATVVVSGNIAAGHQVSARAVGSITEVGFVNNTISAVSVKDASNNDCTRNYDITRVEGILSVSSVGGGGYAIGAPPDEETKTMLRVYSEREKGAVYLKQMSYGDYRGSGFWDIRSYPASLGDGYGFGYLASNTLEKSGYAANGLSVELCDGTAFVLPYYAAPNGVTVQTSDVSYICDARKYDVQQYMYAYDYSVSLTPTESAAVTAYNEYVKKNYLQIPRATKEYMLGVADENSIYADKATVISDVAQYIRSAATYDLQFDRKLNAEPDIAVAFLRDYKKGICQHYATAATMMYRALGIPARFTIGYKGAAVPGEWYEVTNKQAHAWVEVYLDDIGWIYVEVTGGSNDGSGDGEGEGEGEGGGEGLSKVKIEVKPRDVRVYKTEAKPDSGNLQISSTPISSSSTPISSETIKELFSFEAVVSGSRREPGYGESTIDSLTIRDTSNKVVYEYSSVLGVVFFDESFRKDYSIKIETGKLQVCSYELRVQAQSASKTYDGTPLVGKYRLLNPSVLTANGHSIVDGSITTAEITDVGAARNTFDCVIHDATGRNITDEYMITVIPGTLRVTPFALTVRTQGKTASFAELNGGALTCSEYDIIDADGNTVDITKFGDASIEVVISGSQSELGRSQNTIESVVVYLDGKNVTGNFVITFEMGWLKVTG